jgi:hypothetical protein
VNTELANKAYAHLLITLIDAINTIIKAYAYLLITLINITDLVTKADLFIYNITIKLYYIFIMFIKIIVNTNVFKKFIASYKQF